MVPFTPQSGQYLSTVTYLFPPFLTFYFLLQEAPATGSHQFLPKQL